MMWSASREFVTSGPNEDDNLLERFKSGTWETLPAKLHKARINYGAAVIESEDGSPLVLVAGGLDEASRSLKSIEVFDPNKNEVSLSKHTLNEARFGCGAFAVTKNVMCLLGGICKGSYSCTVERVSSTQKTILLPDKFHLPKKMAYFGTAVVSVHDTKMVYIFGGETGVPTDTVKKIILKCIYRAKVDDFRKYLKLKEVPTSSVWEPVGTSIEPARRKFALVAKDNVVWLFGGVNKRERVVHVGRFDAETNKYTKHEYKKYDCVDGTGVALGKNIAVLGGILPSMNASSKNTSYSLSRGTSKRTSVIASVPARGTDKPFFFPTDLKPSRLDKCEEKSYSDFYTRGQSVFKVDQKIYAIAQYDFQKGKPLPDIKCMDLTLKVPMQKGPTHLDDDAQKIYRVKCGKDNDPVSVSKDFGRVCTGNYDKTKEVGKGGFGNVFFGFYNSSKIGEPIQCVIKRINEIENEDALETFENELKILSKIRQPNILMLYGYHLDPNSDDCFLVYEYLDGGSLADFLRYKDRRTSLLYKQRLRIMENVLCALNYFHSGGTTGDIILHRDVKPHNICLTKDRVAKLIDFGLARIQRSDDIDNSGASMKNKVGTNSYMCKKYADEPNFRYRPACDIYSFGIVMIELITGKLNGEHPDFPDGYYGQFKDEVSLKEKCDTKIVWPNDETHLMRLCKLALQCLSINPDERPSSIELLTEINNMFLENPPCALQKGSTDSGAYSACDVCNQKLLKSMECKNKHILCSDCLSSLVVDTVMNKGLNIVTCSKCEYIYPTGELYSKIDKQLHYQLLVYKAIKRLEKDVGIIKDSTNLMMLALAKVSVIVGNQGCPHLILIKPRLKKELAIRKPSEWLNNVEIVELYFCCEYTGKPVSTPEILKLSKTRKWIQKIAPAMILSIRVLKFAKAVAKLPWPVVNMAGTVDMIEQAGDFLSFLVDDKSLFDNLEKDDPDFFDEKNDKAKRKIYGPAYKELEEKFAAEGKFKEELVPIIRRDGSTIWVQKDKAEVARV